jgi:hypothetical protein
LLLLHVPPVELLAHAVVAPAHTVLPPLIAPGAAYTERIVVTEQPDTAYVIVAVPVAIAETTPVLLTVATAVLLLLHVPPEVVFVRAVVLPAQTDVVPPMAEGVALTVIDFVAVQPEPVE